MSRTLEMFEKPRKQRKWLMHVSDVSSSGACCEPEDGEVVVQFMCQRCKHETDWVRVPNMTAAKRGQPCDLCNQGEK